MLMRVDVISDTHGYLDPKLLKQLEGADVIVHAGDICSFSDLMRLQNIAHVQAVLGNNDWASEYGGMLSNVVSFTLLGITWEVSHYKQRLHPGEFDIIVSGHTHRPALKRTPEGALAINPGSATRPRSEKPASFARVMLDQGRIVSASILSLDGDVLEEMVF